MTLVVFTDGAYEDAQAAADALGAAGWRPDYMIDSGPGKWLIVMLRADQAGAEQHPAPGRGAEAGGKAQADNGARPGRAR